MRTHDQPLSVAAFNAAAARQNKWRFSETPYKFTRLKISTRSATHQPTNGHEATQIS